MFLHTDKDTHGGSSSLRDGSAPQNNHTASLPHSLTGGNSLAQTWPAQENWSSEPSLISSIFRSLHPSLLIPFSHPSFPPLRSAHSSLFRFLLPPFLPLSLTHFTSTSTFCMSFLHLVLPPFPSVSVLVGYIVSHLASWSLFITPPLIWILISQPHNAAAPKRKRNANATRFLSAAAFDVW